MAAREFRPRIPDPGSRLPAADLHLHTTASDGLSSPADLVSAAWRAGLSTIAVTDHDTTAALPDVERLATETGLAFVPGIEITAVWEGSDVHLLAYFVDARSARLSEFLRDQQADRRRRARLIAIRLANEGVALDVEGLIARSESKVVSRPLIAEALVEAGHVPDVASAFDRYLAEGRSAYVARWGATPAEVVALVSAIGGFVSMAHPGVTGRDDLISGLAADGLGALEVHHPDHTPAETARYCVLAKEAGLTVSGGSDYHGEGTHHGDTLGSVGLTDDEFAAFCARANRPMPQPS